MGTASKFGEAEWRNFLRGWSEAFFRDIANVEQRSFLFAYSNLRGPVERKWLGELPASPPQIESAERRLQVEFPEDYRSFLVVTDGWTAPAFNKGRMLSPLTEIDLFAVRHPETFSVVVDDGGTFPFADEGMAPVDPEAFRHILALSDADNSAFVLFDPRSSARPFWHLDFHGPSTPFRTFTEMVLFAKEWSDRNLVEMLEFQAIEERGRAV